MSCRTPDGLVWRRYLRRRGGQILRVLALGRAELSLSLVSDREMRGLNRTWRGRDRPTDVLAFPLAGDDAPIPAPGRGRLAAALGDVVISIETAARQARAARRALACRLDQLLVHGTLHLLGYDHEGSPAEARRMAARARTLAAALRAAPAARRAGAPPRRPHRPRGRARA